MDATNTHPAGLTELEMPVWEGFRAELSQAPVGDPQSWDAEGRPCLVQIRAFLSVFRTLSGILKFHKLGVALHREGDGGEQ